MKKTKMILGLSLVAVSGLILVAADHVDAPAVTGNAADITDVYTFQGQDTNNLAFAVNTQGLLSPNATAAATFNENVMIEINIDNTGDNVEDLVIQAIKRDDKMYFFGPYAPTTTGTSSTIKTSCCFRKCNYFYLRFNSYNSGEKRNEIFRRTKRRSFLF